MAGKLSVLEERDRRERRKEDRTALKETMWGSIRGRSGSKRDDGAECLWRKRGKAVVRFGTPAPVSDWRGGWNLRNGTESDPGFRRSVHWHRGPLRETGGSASLFPEGLDPVSVFLDGSGVMRWSGGWLGMGGGARVRVTRSDSATPRTATSLAILPRWVTWVLSKLNPRFLRCPKRLSIPHLRR